MRLARQRLERLAVLGRPRVAQGRSWHGQRTGLFDEVREVPVPALDPRDRIDGYIGVITDFVRAVRGGTEPETVGHDNIRSLAMALGAIDSADAARHVEIVI